MIRAFVAIPIPDNVTRLLTGIQAGLDFGRIVPAENFHITLAYLGEHPEPVIEDVHTLLDTVQPAPIDLRIEGLGVFGGEKPRSLFAEVVPSKPLSTLRKKIRTAARNAGIDLGHEHYHPHITLARFPGNGLVGPEVLDLQAFLSARMGRTKGAFTAEHFILYESRLGSEAPHYMALAKYRSQEDQLKHSLTRM